MGRGEEEDEEDREDGDVGEVGELRGEGVGGWVWGVGCGLLSSE